MITCTFIGADQYDLDLYEKIEAAVKDMVSKADEIEFLFYRRTEIFYHLCFWAVLKAKSLFPHKKIIMTLIMKNHDSKEEPFLEKWAKLPIWAFDQIVPVIPSPAERPVASIWSKIERSMIRRSDYVIASCYPELHGSDYRLLEFARNRRHVRTLNLLNDKTTDYIRAAIKTLPTSEREIIEKINAGHHYTSLAQSAGISVTAIHTKESRGHWKLRKLLAERLEQARIKQGPAPHGICGVLISNGITAQRDEVRNRLYEISNYLMKSIGISAFMMEQNDLLSYNMDPLSRFRDDFELTVVTHDSTLQKRYDYSYIKQLPIDSEVKPMWARYFRGIQEILKRSEYMICYFSGSTAMDLRIRRRMEKQKGLMIIDLGNTPHIADPQPLERF